MVSGKVILNLYQGPNQCQKLISSSNHNTFVFRMKIANHILKLFSLISSRSDVLELTAQKLA